VLSHNLTDFTRLGYLIVNLLLFAQDFIWWWLLTVIINFGTVFQKVLFVTVYLYVGSELDDQGWNLDEFKYRRPLGWVFI
jgi:hypothetical protein